MLDSQGFDSKMEEKNNIDLFNEYVAVIFSHLYEKFPVPSRLSAREASGNLEDSHHKISKNTEICIETIRWLKEAGYIWYEKEHTFGAYDAVLSQKGLELLKVVPESLKEDKSVGDKLLEVMASGGKSAASDLIKLALTQGYKLFL